MEEINSKSKQEECLNTVMKSVDHTGEGKKYLEKGLELARKGDIDNAVECFYQAAAAFDRYSKLVPALWETIGNILEPDFKENRSKYFEALREGKIRDVDDEWYQFPLVYHVKAATYYDWRTQNDPVHKQAWVYGWGAEHLQRLTLYEPAYTLFFRAAEKAERTKTGKDYPGWPAKLYQKSILNFIRAYGTIDHAPDKQRIKKGISDREVVAKEGIKKMEKRFLAIKNQTEAYRSLAISYRLLKSALIEAGNLTEAEQFKRKECSALMHYYFHSRSYFRAIAEWLSGIGFMYFIIALFLIVLFVFPYIYYQWDLITSAQGTITYPNAILYSFESALNIGHNEYYAVGVGKLLNIIEAALSWLGLGVFIWWITRRLE